MTVAIRNKRPVVVPDAALRRAGFRSGQELEVRASGGVITIVSRPASADDEYTPEQRRIIDVRLGKALADVESGRTAGPFETADEMISTLRREIRKRTGKTAKPRGR
jgi:bifunctional DNA-binding transcriptional regulator/antitoxin component of YhaV-PrlF toxin-antitoxin module